jgi:hypothetical protein
VLRMLFQPLFLLLPNGCLGFPHPLVVSHVPRVGLNLAGSTRFRTGDSSRWLTHRVGSTRRDRAVGWAAVAFCCRRGCENGCGGGGFVNCAHNLARRHASSFERV